MDKICCMLVRLTVMFFNRSPFPMCQNCVDCVLINILTLHDGVRSTEPDCKANKSYIQRRMECKRKHGGFCRFFVLGLNTCYLRVLTTSFVFGTPNRNVTMPEYKFKAKALYNLSLTIRCTKNKIQ